ncbi:MAG: response regulator [Anaerolineae bacterium]|jgi:CheY-like chemotaxis protein|nr:response regulator [Anaerolineae bacterium]
MSSDIRVLIIDDNSSDANVLQKLLGRMDIAYDVLYDTRTLFADLARVPKPNVVFLDLEIPGTDGYKVLSAIRSIPDFDNIPVVAYTANSAEMVNCQRAGFHSFLGKPIRSGDFAHHLERILNDDPVWEVR